MVDKRQGKKSGRKSGRRGILSTKGVFSLPLRFTFCGKTKTRSTIPPKVTQPLLKPGSYISSKVKPFQGIAICPKWLFLLK